MLSIGQFSKICMVTVKALRYYDKIGLIHPCEINEENGYRFYSEEQISEMLLINRLKFYGFSLSDIKEILSCNNELFLNKLKKQRETLSNSIKNINSVIDEIDKHIASFERTGNVMEYQNNYNVKIVNTEDIYVISNRQNMSIDDFGKYYGMLYKRCSDENIILNGLCMAIYHDAEFDPQNSDIELALGVNSPDMSDKKIPGNMCAQTTHYGSYSKLSEAYGAVMKWINNNGFKIAAPPYKNSVR